MGNARIETIIVDNDGPHVSKGTLTILDLFAFPVSGTLSLNDGDNPVKIFSVVNQGGSNTDKDTVDLGGGPSSGVAASRFAEAINLANVANEVDISALVSDNLVHLAHDVGPVANIPISTNIPSAGMSVEGMHEGSTDPGVPRFTAVGPVEDGAGLKSIAITAIDGTLRLSLDLNTDPSIEGRHTTLAQGATKKMVFDVSDQVSGVYVNGANAKLEVEYTYGFIR